MKENLTQKYANGTNPHILGRDKEVELAFLTLMRHEKPNVLLTGEAGVGKTSIVHQWPNSTVFLFHWIGVYFALPLFLLFYLKFMGRHGWALSVGS